MKIIVKSSFKLHICGECLFVCELGCVRVRVCEGVYVCVRVMTSGCVREGEGVKVSVCVRGVCVCVCVWIEKNMYRINQ